MQDILYAVGGIAATIFLYNLFRSQSLQHIPTVGGPTLPLLSYIGSFKALFYGRDVIQDGYRKYKDSMFKMALFDRWMVVVCGTKLVEEFHRLPDEYVSFYEGSGEVFASKYIFERVFGDLWHGPVIREQMTRKLGVMFDDVNEEVIHALDHFVVASEKEWTPIDAHAAIRDIVAQTSARALSGYPLCRNREYLNVQTDLTMHAVKGEAMLGIVPPALKPLVARMITNFRYYEKRAQRFVLPIIEDRIAHLKDHPDWPDKPIDLLQSLIEGAIAREKPVEDIAALLLATNFVAIDTTSNTFTHALYHLATTPEYAIPLREEISAIVEETGWSKQSLSRMRKLDSFFRETVRYGIFQHVTMIRKTLQDVTFSTGTFIPAGTIIAVPTTATHMDEDKYSNAEVFNPFRFSDLREEDSVGGGKYQMTATSSDYLGFSHGRHACPGRFFAAMEMKLLMAHLLLDYDVKLAQEGVRPADHNILIMNIPNWSTKVLFKRRVGQS